MSNEEILPAERLLLPEQLAEIVRDNAQDAVMLRTFPVVADTADWKSATQIQKLLAHIESQARFITQLMQELSLAYDASGQIEARCKELEQRAAAEPEGWQPIDTAPKGVKILVAYKNSLGKWRRVLARWYGEDELESCDSDNESGFAQAGWYEESETQEDIRVTDESPEFWHNIPAPPPTKEGSNGQ